MADNGNPANGNPTEPPAPDPAATPPVTPQGDPAPAPDPAAPTDKDPNAPPPLPEPPAEDTPIEYNFQLPEGVSIDPEVAQQLTEYAQANKLTPEAAQGLADLAMKYEAKKAEQYENAKAEWATLSESDKEFGGTQFKENLAVASRALDTFGTPELKSLLKSTGFGNHPEVIRVFYKMGKAVGEDKLVVRGTETPPAPTKDPVKLYANSQMQP